MVGLKDATALLSFYTGDFMKKVLLATYLGVQGKIDSRH